jgi:hypothetical protein
MCHPRFAAVMIGASHNPAGDTGQKLLGPGTRAIAAGIGPGGGLDRIKSFHAAGAAPPAAPRGPQRARDLVDAYVAHRTRLAGVEPGGLRGARILHDYLFGAYNLANFIRQLVLPRPNRGWALTALREKLLKIGAKVVAPAKHVVSQVAEVAVPRKLFAQTLERIAGLCLGVRLSAPTTGSESRRRSSAVCSVGGFRGLNEGEASCAVGIGRGGRLPAAFLRGKSLQSFPRVSKLTS